MALSIVKTMKFLKNLIFCSEEDFPYTSGETGETGECTYDANTQTAAVYVRGYETLPHNSLEAVMNHVATVGPLGISVDASVWHSYEGGIFDGCSYEENIEINHGVQVEFHCMQ